MPTALKIVLLSTVVIAGLCDLRFRRIPNWLNLSALALGIGINTAAFHERGLILALLGISCAVVVYFPLYLIRGMGAGDVKLMAAVGAIVGPSNWLKIFLVTAFFGAFLALLLIVLKKRFQETFWNIAVILRELSSGRLPSKANPQLDIRHSRSAGMPHGTVVAMSSVAFLLLGTAP